MALADAFPARDRLAPTWLMLLLAMAALSSVTFACVTPFAAFAVLTAATMRWRAALLAMVAVWLVNQLLGYLALGYPLDAMSLAWGGAIGLAALAATGAARALLSRPSWLRLGAAFVAAVAVYEGVLFLVSLGLGGSGNFAPAIVVQVAFYDACWLVGLALLGVALARLAPAWRPVRRTVIT